MAVDMFMKIDGVTGESQDQNGHGGEIDVLAWSWGISNSGTTHMGSGSGGGKANVQDLSFTKYVDVSSPDLALACLNGKHFATATLTVRKAGETPLEYIILEMTDVIVTSISKGGSGGEDRLTENLSLNFGQIHEKYVEQTPQGGTGGQPDYTYDIAGNIKK